MQGGGFFGGGTGGGGFGTSPSSSSTNPFGSPSSSSPFGSTASSSGGSSSSSPFGAPLQTSPFQTSTQPTSSSPFSPSSSSSPFPSQAPPSQQQQQTQSASQSPFVCVVPGRPAIFTFQQVSHGKWAQQIPEAQSIRQLTFFLTQPIQNPSFALTIYVSLPPFQDWIYLGALSNNVPSNVFQVRWPLSAKSLGASFPAQIGVGLEPGDQVVQRKSPVPPQDEEYKLFAKFIAADLFRFMESFNKHTDNRNEFLLIPTKVLDMWYEKFQNKFKHDPFFWTRKE